MDIAIVGAGAMGQLIGARLADAGSEVVLIDVSEHLIHHIESEGLRVRTEKGERSISVRASPAAEAEGPAKLIILLTKSVHTRAAVDSIRHLASPKTYALTLQNGLGNEEPLAELVGRERVLMGVTTYPADQTAPGRVISSEEGRIVLGPLGDAPHARRAAESAAAMLMAAGLRTLTHPRVMIPVWEKLIFNTVLNTVSAATGLTVGAVKEGQSARKLADAVLEEALAVAHGLDVDVDDHGVRAQIERAYEEHGSHKTSMLADLESGRETEVDAIGGAVAAQARRLGIRTPHLDVLCDVVRARMRLI
ncbi:MULTISPECIES: 2-dehydropantoate 2-reductase [Actinomycetes]|uniref:2-dehydropantoate 2-reductase n=2 Tax=Actinomycetes TaxID=1760 RepID=A0ABP6LRT9_9MICC